MLGPAHVALLIILLGHPAGGQLLKSPIAAGKGILTAAIIADRNIAKH